MIILGTNSIKAAGGYDVANSLRFNDGSSDDLQKTFGTSTNTDIFTISIWVKRSTLGINNFFVYSTGGNSDDNWFQVGWNTTDKFVISAYNTVWLRTNRLFRDVSAWYHIVIQADSTQATASNRLKLYVNGVEETSFSDDNRGSISSSQTWGWNKTGNTGYVGSKAGNNYFDGYMAEVVLLDGNVASPTDFGEFDSDSGIWKPIDVSGLTFGNNGFYLDFEDSSALGNDAAGSNNFTVNNLTAIDQTTDTCTNNFALANPLNVNASNVGTFAFGNTTVKVANSSGFSFGSSSTIGVSSGKWYCEAKIITVDATMVGVSANVAEDARDNYPPGVQGGAQSVGILVSSGNKYIDDSGTTHGAALSADDILMIALDLDNNNVYFGKDGNWFDGSGNADESSPNSAIAITAAASTQDGAYFFSFGDGGGSSKGKVSWNFGNASHAISSGNTDGNGYGNFEYVVPSGYYSLNTKNLAEYGG